MKCLQKKDGSTIITPGNKAGKIVGLNSLTGVDIATPINIIVDNE